MARHAFRKTYETIVPALGTDVEGSYIAAVAPFDGVLHSAEFIPVAGITGADTDTRKHEVINKGAAGAGSVVMAELQYNSGVNATAFDSKPITKSATAEDLEVVEGDVIAWVSTAPGTGLADPGGMVRLVFARSVA